MTRKRTSRNPRRETGAGLSPRQSWHLRAGSDSPHVEGAPWATRRDYERANRRYDAGDLGIFAVGVRCHDPSKLMPTPPWIEKGQPDVASK
jgi:hypothetical protein